MIAEDKARHDIIRLGKALYDRGITPGRTGNLSVRLGDRVLITPTNACLGRLDLDRLSLLDERGTLISGDQPSKEFVLHRSCYRRDEAVRAVAHVHSTHAVAVSCLRDLDRSAALPPLTAYFVMRVGSLPLLPYFAPGDPGLAAALLAAPASRCALLANHGSIAGASDLESAVDAVEEIEEAAKLMLLLHGRDTRPLSPDQVAGLTRPA